ncbi:MAG: aspartate aminotransferase family protein [Bacteroidales bacterium]|jgi:acetylornithine/N-succinyldiaminopimelate aminotransferase|nr:aspartate aminotransferase family protein [Bacteroidales bacterium]MDN5349192.1 acetylornithine/N-succinyldiaminopimelate aminotransferase [Bacteroidales bacterium]
MNFDNTKQYLETDATHYLQVFKRYPLVLEKGKGAKVWDTDGKSYIDLLAGIAVNSLGHAHPKLVKAISEQAAELMHVSNFFLSKPQAQLSKNLTEISGLERVFLSNSGAESVEGAIKLARKYAYTKNRGAKIIYMSGSFHGRTLATMAMGSPNYQQGYAPVPEGFVESPFNDLEALKAIIDDDTIAIILEPIQGEGGINMAEKSFIKGIRQLCDEKDMLLILDEIQTGVGRTGHWFAKDYFGVQPDIMTLAKGLGGGFPIGAILCNKKVNDAMHYGGHGTTFGGNPLASKAALTVLETIESENIMPSVAENGKWLMQQFEALNHPKIKSIRGLGLMIGIEFHFDTKALVAGLLEKGVMANSTAGNVLRIVPPLIITKAELEEAFTIIKETLKQY